VTTLAPPVGCRTIELVYATTTTASGATLGDIAGQVKQVRYWRRRMARRCR